MWKDKVKKVLDYECDRKYGNEEWQFEIYCSYDDEFSDSSIIKFCKADDPRSEMEETLWEWACDYDDSWLFDEIKKEFDSETYEACEDEIIEYINEHTSFNYPENHFNRDVCVNIMVDTGDANYDFVKNNVLNYYNYYTGGKLESEASITWLSKQQRKKTKLDKAIKKCLSKYPDKDFTKREMERDFFVESVIQELENLTCHMSILTFLVKMPLFQLFDLLEAIKAEEKLNESYDANKRKGTGYIVIDKNTECGLFCPWQGGGSVLEIELDKDVKLPIKYIFSAMPDGSKQFGYDVGDAYGLLESAWHGEVKEINKM